MGGGKRMKFSLSGIAAGNVPGTLKGDSLTAAILLRGITLLWPFARKPVNLARGGAETIRGKGTSISSFPKHLKQGKKKKTSPSGDSHDGKGKRGAL